MSNSSPPEAVPFIEKMPLAPGGLPVEKKALKLPLIKSGAHRAVAILPEALSDTVRVATGAASPLATHVPLPDIENEVDEPPTVTPVPVNVKWTFATHSPFQFSADAGVMASATAATATIAMNVRMVRLTCRPLVAV